MVTICNVSNLPFLEADESVESDNMLEVAKNLSDFDNIGISLTNRQDLDKQAMNSYKSNVTKDPFTGQYIVGFPWLGNTVPNSNELDSNYNLVKARFNSTMAKLDKNPEKRNQYKTVHMKEIENKFIELVPEKELRDNSIVKNYLYHFCLIMGYLGRK